jgi:DNA polymerase-1
MQPLYSNKTVKEDMLDELGQPIRFKSGLRSGEIRTRSITSPDITKPKGKIHELTIVLPQQVKPRADWKGKQLLRDGTPIYGTGADVIDAIGNMDGIGDIASLFAKYTKLDKDVGTYYINADGSKGMLTCVNELQIIHHSLNHCTTKTTRMSASNPNCQNLPRGDKSEVKKMFVSRFDGGRVAEIDYSQLEIVIQAWLTGCEAMIADVNNGIDFHCKRLSAKLNEPYEHVLHMCKEEKDEWYGIQRTIAKGFTFQRAYGAGAPAIAGDLNVPVEEIEQLIAAEELLYPGLSVFDLALEAAIMESAKSPSMTKREAHPFIPNRFRAYKQGQWQAPTGTLYKWRQWDAPDYLQRRGIEMTFSPTERKNWPMQGTGGEVMQMALGLCFRHFVEQDWWSGAKDADALLTNTVHDCAWVDMRSEDVAPIVLGDMHDIMVNMPLFMNKRYGIDVPVKFKAEVEVGHDMYDMHHLHELTPTVNVDQLAQRYL